MGITNMDNHSKHPNTSLAKNGTIQKEENRERKSPPEEKKKKKETSTSCSSYIPLFVLLQSAQQPCQQPSTTYSINE
jgi:hypothetical protein